MRQIKPRHNQKKYHQGERISTRRLTSRRAPTRSEASTDRVIALKAGSTKNKTKRTQRLKGKEHQRVALASSKERRALRAPAEALRVSAKTAVSEITD